MLLLTKWRVVWEDARPPSSKWYMDSSKSFSQEFQKSRLMLNPHYSNLQTKARSAILDLHGMLLHEKLHKNGINAYE